MTLLQYRNKEGDTRQMLQHAREIKRVLEGKVTLIMNDRADICVAVGYRRRSPGPGRPAGGRRTTGRWQGSGSSEFRRTIPQQVKEADAEPADYIAIGPVFPTTGKKNPDALVGLEGVSAARAATKKPLVAIGGITRHNAKSVIEAGPIRVAVISDLLSSPRRVAEEFLRLLV